jgi:hypothetical protein
MTGGHSATKLRLARPREIPLLRMMGWEVCGDWSQSFVLMQLHPIERDISHETKTADVIDLRSFNHA